MVTLSPKIVTAEGGERAIPAILPGASQKVALGAASVQSTAVTGSLIRVVGQSDCHLAFGANPTAVADGTCVFLPAGIPEYFVFISGNRVAVIQDSSATGNLFITAAQ